MALFDLFEVAGSGMNAQMVRLNTIASNMANADAGVANPQDAYRPRMPVFAAALQNSLEMSDAVPVRVLGIVESTRPPLAEFAPGNPLANEQGFVYKPNVSVAEQMADMISASRSFQSNVEVMNTTRELMLRTIQLGQN